MIIHLVGLGIDSALLSRVLKIHLSFSLTISLALSLSLLSPVAAERAKAKLDTRLESPADFLWYQH